jgi:hypothetical protein
VVLNLAIISSAVGGSAICVTLLRSPLEIHDWPLRFCVGLPDQIVVGQATARDLRHHATKAIRVRGLAIVEAVRLLVQVAEQVERFDRNVGALDGALELQKFSQPFV